jgi:hypothetical protein
MDASDGASKLQNVVEHNDLDSVVPSVMLHSAASPAPTMSSNIPSLVCSYCALPFKGRYFVCLLCDDFKLCRVCFDSRVGEHEHHDSAFDTASTKSSTRASPRKSLADSAGVRCVCGGGGGWVVGGGWWVWVCAPVSVITSFAALTHAVPPAPAEPPIAAAESLPLPSTSAAASVPAQGANCDPPTAACAVSASHTWPLSTAAQTSAPKQEPSDGTQDTPATSLSSHHTIAVSAPSSDTLHATLADSTMVDAARPAGPNESVQSVSRDMSEDLESEIDMLLGRPATPAAAQTERRSTSTLEAMGASHPRHSTPVAPLSTADIDSVLALLASPASSPLPAEPAPETLVTASHISTPPRELSSAPALQQQNTECHSQPARQVDADEPELDCSLLPVQSDIAAGDMRTAAEAAPVLLNTPLDEPASDAKTPCSSVAKTPCSSVAKTPCSSVAPADTDLSLIAAAESAVHSIVQSALSYARATQEAAEMQRDEPEIVGSTASDAETETGRLAMLKESPTGRRSSGDALFCPQECHECSLCLSSARVHTSPAPDAINPSQLDEWTARAAASEVSCWKFWTDGCGCTHTHTHTHTHIHIYIRAHIYIHTYTHTFLFPECDGQARAAALVSELRALMAHNGGGQLDSCDRLFFPLLLLPAPCIFSRLSRVPVAAAAGGRERPSCVPACHPTARHPR